MISFGKQELEQTHDNSLLGPRQYCCHSVYSNVLYCMRVDVIWVKFNKSSSIMTTTALLQLLSHLLWKRNKVLWFRYLREIVNDLLFKLQTIDKISMWYRALNGLEQGTYAVGRLSSLLQRSLRWRLTRHLNGTSLLGTSREMLKQAMERR